MERRRWRRKILWGSSTVGGAKEQGGGDKELKEMRGEEELGEEEAQDKGEVVRGFGPS